MALLRSSSMNAMNAGLVAFAQNLFVLDEPEVHAPAPSTRGEPRHRRDVHLRTFHIRENRSIWPRPKTSFAGDNAVTFVLELVSTSACRWHVPAPSWPTVLVF